LGKESKAKDDRFFCYRWFHFRLNDHAAGVESNVRSVFERDVEGCNCSVAADESVNEAIRGVADDLKERKRERVKERVCVSKQAVL
jgi:hypothetical protein